MRFQSLVKFGVVLAAILTLLLGMGVLIAVQFLDLNQAKEILTAQVKKATGRTLTIAGPLELQVGLVPVVGAKGVTLSNPEGSSRPDLVKIEHFEMEIALMPLLKREIVVNRLILSAPDILVETDANGPVNLDFSRSTEQSELKPGEPVPQTAAGGDAAYRFTLNELKITHGLVTWHDRTSQKTESLEIQELTVQADRDVAGMLAVHLLTRVREQQVELSGTVGRAEALLGGKPFPLNLKAQLQGITLTAEGSIADLAAFSGLQIKVAAQGPELTDVIRLAGVTKPELPHNLGPFNLSAHLSDAGKHLNLSDVVAEAGTADLMLLNAKGSIADIAALSGLQIKVTAHGPELVNVLRLAGITKPELPPNLGPFNLSAHLSDAGKQLNLSDVAAEAGTTELILLNAKGTIKDLAAFKGLQIKIAARGPELSNVLRLAGVTKPELPPSLGPFNLSAHLSDAGKQLDLTDVVAEAGKADLMLINAKGTIKDLAGAAAVNLHLNMASDNPIAVAKLAGARFSGKGPMKLTGQLQGRDKAWTMTDLKTSAGSSDLNGELTVTLAERTKISGNLASTTLHLADFTAPVTPAAAGQLAAEKSAPQPVNVQRGDGRVFSNKPLPFTALPSADADLTVQVGTLVLANEQLTNVAVSLHLNNGRLILKPFRFGLADGVLEGEASLDTSKKTPAAALRMQGRQIELGKLDSKGPIIGGKSDLEIDLKGSGESVRALMASATGETRISVGQGRLRSKAVELAGGDILFQILGAINPFAKNEETTQMTCAAARFSIRDGVAAADKGLAMRTSQVDMLGSGTVDLRSERLDLDIKPRARRGVGVSFTTPLAGLVKVGGTIAKPSVGIDTAGTLRTAASVGAGIATGGLSTIGEMLLDKVTADEDPCRTALGQPQQGQTRQKAEPQKQSPGSILKGLFGR